MFVLEVVEPPPGALDGKLHGGRVADLAVQHLAKLTLIRQLEQTGGGALIVFGELEGGANEPPGFDGRFKPLARIWRFGGFRSYGMAQAFWFHGRWV